MASASDEEPVEETHFEYTSDGGGGGAKLWLEGDTEPREEFDFRITNARVSVETPGAGERFVPLPFLRTVRTNTDEGMSDLGRRRAKRASFAVMGVIGLFTLAGAVVKSPAEAIFAGGFWFVIWIVVGGKLESLFTHEWRWFEFVADSESAPRHVRLDPATPEYDPDDLDGEFKLRIPERRFTRDRIDGVALDQARIAGEHGPYGLLAALLDGIGARVETPERVTIDLTTDDGASGAGGPLHNGYYRCENCGEKLDMATEVRKEFRAYTCRNCGHELDDQDGASEQELEAEMAWEAGEEWQEQF